VRAGPSPPAHRAGAAGAGGIPPAEVHPGHRVSVTVRARCPGGWARRLATWAAPALGADPGPGAGVGPSRRRPLASRRVLATGRRHASRCPTCNRQSPAGLGHVCAPSTGLTARLELQGMGSGGDLRVVDGGLLEAIDIFGTGIHSRQSLRGFEPTERGLRDLEDFLNHRGGGVDRLDAGGGGGPSPYCRNG
jgi:hypothetical protein